MTQLSEIIELAKTYDQVLPPPPGPLPVPVGAEITGWIDHTLLKPDGTESQIRRLCREALEYEFASVCVNPSFVWLVADLLKESPVETCTVIGFPLGATLPTIKMAETMATINAGATEVDMVLNIGGLKGQAYGQVLNDILGVVGVAHNQDAIVKVIIETALLTRQEKIEACLLCKAAGADFVKTSTGFSTGGATVEDVELMRRVVGPEIGVKAAGGIHTYADALAMIRAGASRIGASAGVKIVHEASS